MKKIIYKVINDDLLKLKAYFDNKELIVRSVSKSIGIFIIIELFMVYMGWSCVEIVGGKNSNHDFFNLFLSGLMISIPMGIGYFFIFYSMGKK